MIQITIINLCDTQKMIQFSIPKIKLHIFILKNLCIGSSCIFLLYIFLQCVDSIKKETVFLVPPKSTKFFSGSTIKTFLNHYSTPNLIFLLSQQKRTIQKPTKTNTKPSTTNSRNVTHELLFFYYPLTSARTQIANTTKKENDTT